MSTPRYVPLDGLPARLRDLPPQPRIDLQPANDDVRAARTIARVLDRATGELPTRAAAAEHYNRTIDQ